MGHEAAVTKSKVMQAVYDCLAQVNTNTGSVGELQHKHNILAKQTSSDVESLRATAKRQGAWCEANEKRLGVTQRQFARFTEGLTFRQRLAWLCFGSLPDLTAPALTGEGWTQPERSAFTPEAEAKIGTMRPSPHL